MFSKTEPECPSQLPAAGQFQITPDSPAHLGFEVKRAILSTDGGHRLAPYLAQIESALVRATRRKTRSHLPAALSARRRVISSAGRETYDLVVLGECKRASEIGLMVNVLGPILEEGLRVGYITEANSVERKTLHEKCERWVKKRQLMLIDPYGGVSLNHFAATTPSAVHDALGVYRALVKRLPRDVDLEAKAMLPLWRISVKGRAWTDMARKVRFDRLLVRNHFGGMSSQAAVDSLESGVPVSTFQHGVVSTPGAFVPVLATQIFTLGPSSAHVLRHQDNLAWRWGGNDPYCRMYVPVGSLLDPIRDSAPRVGRDSVLVLDQHALWAEKFYGMGRQFAEFREAVRTLLVRCPEISKVIIRTHPNSMRESHWSTLQREFSSRIEISGALPLQEDLRRSAVVLGMFSGALASAAASGLPTLFLWRPGWLHTPDLDGFVDVCFTNPDAAAGRVSRLLSDKEVWVRSSDACRTVGKTFFSAIVDGWSDIARRIIHCASKPVE